ncbi:MAG: AraC family transcriptional regulator [Clostridiales bacterium]|nr:AraC family transcriptional regulator [Clostridiales bacterium]
MQGWLEGMQRSIDYLEAHLEERVDLNAAAEEAGLSPFYFQRIFGALCGMTVGEYLRARRMTRAGQMLSHSDCRVLEAALALGYDSADSFARAFQRFHGIPPSRAREKGVTLRSFAPVHFHISLEGGHMLEYRIVEKKAFTIMGIRRKFLTETGYTEIPKFWAEWAGKADHQPPMGAFGLCMDDDGQEFDYWIADLYIPWEDLPEGCETHTLPAGLWAEFTCRGPLPESLQSVNTQIWSEWLPSLKGYRLAGPYSLEVYSPPMENPEEMINYIWIPLVREEKEN